MGPGGEERLGSVEPMEASISCFSGIRLKKKVKKRMLVIEIMHPSAPHLWLLHCESIKN